MTILDAYAVIAYLRDEPAADPVRPLLEHGPRDLTAVGLAEVVDHLVRLSGANEEDVVLDLAQLGLLDALPVNAAAGSAAGRLRARHYHRTRCPISMADAIAAETARSSGRALATADPDLLNVCHAEGIRLLALPGSNGSTWKAPTDPT
ncbi:MAG TPA: PIN domain-containing protein [Jatrophihabitantaceae bacterium]|nr:PIN domain-containing protein [Jatrophihabitantaceae bacterium]